MGRWSKHSVPIPPFYASYRPTPSCIHRGCKGFVCPGRASSTSLRVNCSSTWLLWHLEHYLYLRQTVKASRWREMSEPHTVPAITEQGSRHQWRGRGRELMTGQSSCQFLPPWPKAPYKELIRLTLQGLCRQTPSQTVLYTLS